MVYWHALQPPVATLHSTVLLINARLMIMLPYVVCGTTRQLQRVHTDESDDEQLSNYLTSSIVGPVISTSRDVLSMVIWLKERNTHPVSSVLPLQYIHLKLMCMCHTRDNMMRQAEELFIGPERLERMPLEC